MIIYHVYKRCGFSCPGKNHFELCGPCFKFGFRVISSGAKERKGNQMGNNSGIQWTNDTWNPWQGCIKVSPGCKNCYMYQEKKRYGKDPATVVRSKAPTFYAPLKKLEGPLVFTCSWSDFFIEAADPWRAEAWDIIRRTPRLTYQILTKRPENILDRLPADWWTGYPNVWLGISAENQAYLDDRLNDLACIPAKVKFVSCEPLLEKIDFCHWFDIHKSGHGQYFKRPTKPAVDWVIIGGESGPGARPFNIFWAVEMVRQCQEAGIPVFMKQIGRRPYAGENTSGEKHWLEPGDQKGGKIDLWPEVIQVREFPAA